MNINKDSWHYKLFDFVIKYPNQETVCSYLRGVIYGVLKVLGIVLLISIVIFGMINWVVLMATGIFLVVPLFYHFISAIILLAGVFGWLTLFIGILVFSYKYLKTKESVAGVIKNTASSISKAYAAVNVPTVKKGSFTDILITYIKNQHDKICTLLTFTND